MKRISDDYGIGEGIFLLYVLIFIGFVCFVFSDIACEKVQRPPPPGYKVLCSVDGKKYTLWMPRGKRGFRGTFHGTTVRGSISPSVWDSEKEAIKFAYYWEKIKHGPNVKDSDKYEWTKCEEVNE